MKEMIACRIPIKFPLKPNENGMCFTRESLQDIYKYFENAPIIKNENAIGILTGDYETIENDECITLFVDGRLFAECNPEIYIDDIINDENGKVVNKFRLNSIDIKL
jgi:hypothetical protein